MNNTTIAALCVSASAMIFSAGAIHLALLARRRTPASAPSAPALIDLDVPMQRDDQGWWSHPGIPNFDEDAKAWHAWLEEQGIETTYDLLEDEPDDHPAYVAYYERNECSCADWDARSPVREREGWRTFSIHDSEDGPVWVWARRRAAIATSAAKEPGK